MAEQPGTHEEREVKYDVADGFAVPDLQKLLDKRLPGASTSRSTVNLRSTYYDTPDRALLHQRITLRKREGDADTGWHLKVPNDLARTEIRLALTKARAVPARLSALVRGVTLGQRLAPVAVLDTTRGLTEIATSTGEKAVEIADDRVAASTPAGERTSEWREVEVELGTGEAATEKLLAAVGKLLIDAGAQESKTGSKLARALGEAADPPDVPGTANAAIAAYLREQFAALTAGDVALRRGFDPVHKTRVGARRTRSILRVFAPVLDAERATALEQELSWYQDLLGEVRDREVQRELLAAAAAELPDELTFGPVAADIDATLHSEELNALQAVRAALDTERYMQLMREVRSFAAEPPVTAGTTKKELRRLAAQARRTAGKRLERATRGEVDPVLLHKARKATKRARYATELVATLGGGSGDDAELIKRHEDAQAILGDHQDAVVAAQNLHRLGVAAGTRSGHNGFSYGLLYERQHAQQQRLRNRIAKFDL